MKKFALPLIAVLFVLPTGIFADEAPPPTPIPSISVSDNCSVTDTDGAAHAYSGQYLGVCALVAAKEQGAVSAYTFQNFSFGLFLQSLNGTTPGATEFWSLYVNGSESMVGLTDLTVVVGDIIKFQLTDWMSSTAIGDPVQFSIGSLVSSAPASTASTGGGGISSLADDFDVDRAILFIKQHQNVDGAMPDAMLTDWAAFAFTSHDIGEYRAKLRSYMLGWTPVMQSTTDYERHAMALMALGIDPYVGTPIDYISPIVSSFDGAQFGSPSLINDDIFAVFPLLHAGYPGTDDMLQKAKSAILATQSPDGSWQGSVDLTAAAIQAISLFERTEDVQRAINRADGYLIAQQKDDGGFGNSFSTAWAMQAIAAIGDSHTVWTKNLYHTPRYYFSTLQQEDGGVEKTDAGMHTRLWATMYAVPGVTGRTWDSLMESFQKPAPRVEEVVATSTSVVEQGPQIAAPITETVEDSKPETREVPETIETAVSEETAPVPESGAIEQAAAAAASANFDVDFPAWLWIAILSIVLFCTGGIVYSNLFKRT